MSKRAELSAGQRLSVRAWEGEGSEGAGAEEAEAEAGANTTVKPPHAKKVVAIAV